MAPSKVQPEPKFVGTGTNVLVICPTCGDTTVRCSSKSRQYIFEHAQSHANSLCPPPQRDKRKHCIGWLQEISSAPHSDSPGFVGKRLRQFPRPRPVASAPLMLFIYSSVCGWYQGGTDTFQVPVLVQVPWYRWNPSKHWSFSHPSN